MNMNKNNQATNQGYIAEELLFSHTVLGESFYCTYVGVVRESGTVDYIPVMLSDKHSGAKTE